MALDAMSSDSAWQQTAKEEARIFRAEIAGLPAEMLYLDTELVADQEDEDTVRYLAKIAVTRGMQIQQEQNCDLQDRNRRVALYFKAFTRLNQQYGLY